MTTIPMSEAARFISDSSADLIPEASRPASLQQAPAAFPFRPGDRVMVPPYGIGVVYGTCSRQVAGQQTAYYAIEFPQSSSRAYVPVGAPRGAGMRLALTSRETPDRKSVV